MKKKVFLPAVAMLVLVVLAISTATYAWFTVRRNADVTVSNITATTGTDLEISTDNASWGKSVQLNLQFSNDKTTDISGNGLDFYKAKFNASNAVTGYEKITGGATGNWVEFPLWFRAKDTMDVFLAETSEIRPADIAARRSTYGNFSRDYISGATRVAFLNQGGDDVNLIWAPNPNIKLNPGSTDTNWTLNNNATTDDNTYEYVKGTTTASSDMETVTIANRAGTNNLSGVNAASDYLVGPVLAPNAYTAGDAYDVNSLGLIDTSNTPAGGWATVQINVKIWVEGTDRDAKEALAGGLFSTYLNFVGYEQPKQPVPESGDFSTGVAGSRVLTISDTAGTTATDIADYEFAIFDSLTNSTTEYKSFTAGSVNGVTVANTSGTWTITVPATGEWTVYVRTKKDTATGMAASSALQFTFAKPAAALIKELDYTQAVAGSNKVAANDTANVVAYDSNLEGKLEYFTNLDSTWKALTLTTKFDGVVTVTIRRIADANYAASATVDVDFTKNPQDAPTVLIDAAADDEDIFINEDTYVVTIKDTTRAIQYRDNNCANWVTLNDTDDLSNFEGQTLLFRFAETNYLQASSTTSVTLPLLP